MPTAPSPPRPLALPPARRRPSRPPRRWLLAALSAALACATAPPHPPAANEPALPGAAGGAPEAPPAPPDIRFEPEEITVSPLDLELSDRNDEELFAVGTAAYEAKDYLRAAAAFARLADRFPASPHLATSLFDAGLAYEQLSEWRLALERFRALTNHYEGPDALEAAFKIAECQYHLGELSHTHDTLEGIAGRPGISAGARVRALTQLGVVELEDGRADDAERTLRRALAAFSAAGEAEQLDPYYPAQAEYYLGETYRGWFLALPVDPSSGDERRLEENLEHKAEMLLSAQGHYLRAIRMGDDRWAVASGSRVGELYDAFRRELIDAPLPPGLDAEQARAYRGELRRRVRVLAAKAVSAYEAALSRAARAGVDDLKVLAEAQASLERLKEALREEAGLGM
ncbi:MAG TPA: tetratricopeptide repeat protein [Anaeromyxobacter sp.]|nr:tetratricopeptide repeat protein [Anaeromyxobacter sp.]